jgi:hypothetical protein
MSILLKTNKQYINNFTIFAERHSGTNFLEKWIVKSFDIPSTWEFGWKHFWIHNTKKLNSPNTLFIGVVRNPYDWLGAMYKIPYHIILKENSTFLDFMNTQIVSKGDGGKFLEEYRDIFSLRETKNQHLLYTMPKICDNYLLLNYENLFGIDVVFKEIVFSFSLQQYQFFANNFQKHQYVLSSLETKIINNNLNWSTENLLNYNINL